MSEQWHENRPPQTELFRVVKFHSKTGAVMFGLTGATKYKYIPNYMDMRGGYEYNQTENPYIPETPVFTGALVHCHRDWMLTIFGSEDTKY